MTTETPTLYSLAGEAYDAFETAQRTEGDEDTSFTRLKDEYRGGWLQDLCHEAHGDFFPDDWKYDAIRAALGWIHDNEPADEGDGAHDFADGYVDAYNASRTAWLASHLQRAFYVDEAREEGLLAADADTFDQLGVGQYMEAREVFGIVWQQLAARLEALEDDDA